jgi:hypothetical protein
MENLAVTVNAETGFSAYIDTENTVCFTEFSGTKYSKVDRFSDICSKIEKGKYRIHATKFYRPEVLLVRTDMDDEAIKYGGLPYHVGSQTYDIGTVRIGQINGEKYVSMIAIPRAQVASIKNSLKRFGTDLRSIGYFGEGLYQITKRKAKPDTPIVIIADDGISCLGLVFINGLLCAARYYNDVEIKLGFVERLVASTTLAQDLYNPQVALFTPENNVWTKALKGVEIVDIRRYYSKNKEITSPLFYNSVGLLFKKGGIFNA